MNELSSSEKEIVDQLSKRVQTLHDVHNQLVEEYAKQISSIQRQKIVLEDNLKRTKKEFEQIKEQATQLKKAVYTMGASLKSKVSSQEFTQMQEKVNSWKLEEYITQKELDPTFDHYAKQQ